MQCDLDAGGRRDDPRFVEQRRQVEDDHRHAPQRILLIDGEACHEAESGLAQLIRTAQGDLACLDRAVHIDPYLRALVVDEVGEGPFYDRFVAACGVDVHRAIVGEDLDRADIGFAGIQPGCIQREFLIQSVPRGVGPGECCQPFKLGQALVDISSQDVAV